MIEVRQMRARSGANGRHVTDDGHIIRVRSAGAPGGYLVVKDGKVVDSFLTKARAEAKAKLLRERSA